MSEEKKVTSVNRWLEDLFDEGNAEAAGKVIGTGHPLEGVTL